MRSYSKIKEVKLLSKKFFILFACILGFCLFLSYIYTQKTQKVSSLKDKPSVEIAGGVVPHHLLAYEIIEKFFKEISIYKSIENIVILAPDHNLVSDKHHHHFLTALNLNEININNTFIQFLLDKNLAEIDENGILEDQGINSFFDYLKKYFPHTKIIPILISPKTSPEEIIQLIQQIYDYSSSNTIIIASVDFSHYLPDEILKLHDVKSIRVLLNFEEENFPFIDVDSWQALYGLRYYAKLKKQEKPIIIGQNTSYGLVSNLPPESEIAKQGGTSYFSVIFEKGAKENLEQINALIVGDIMMGRGVQILTDRFGFNYPFKNIINIFKGLDLIIGNFEGVLVENATFIPLNSTSFGYPLSVAQELKNIGFNLLTLSNNHSLDKGEKALIQTRDFFKSIGIEPLGDYHSCKKDFYYQYKNLLFIGANLVYQNKNCINEIISNVKEIKLINPETFIIFIPHWGTEYVHHPNSFQKKTAYLLVDNGVDLIIGHHPHVVQAIEKYKGKLIFYSLGNFVFDMYFSKAVQEGLGLGLSFKKDRLIIYLIPFKSTKSQLNLFENDEKQQFLTWLAEISDNQLKEEIIDGILIQNIK